MGSTATKTTRREDVQLAKDAPNSAGFFNAKAAKGKDQLERLRAQLSEIV